MGTAACGDGLRRRAILSGLPGSGQPRRLWPLGQLPNVAKLHAICRLQAMRN